MPIESKFVTESFLDEARVSEICGNCTVTNAEKSSYFGEDFAGREDCSLPAEKETTVCKHRKELGPFFADQTLIGLTPRRNSVRPKAPLSWREREMLMRKQKRIRRAAWLSGSAAAAAAIWMAFSALTKAPLTNALESQRSVTWNMNADAK